MRGAYPLLFFWGGGNGKIKWVGKVLGYVYVGSGPGLLLVRPAALKPTSVCASWKPMGYYLMTQLHVCVYAIPHCPESLHRRHADTIRQCREAGARIRLISDGDVAGAIEVAKAGAPVDIMMGIGGTPEGVIAGAL